MSVIVPCFNQGLFLNECLHSISMQSYTNWECIVVNDGSRDETEEVAKKWLEKDKRFKYVYQENKGLSSARNMGLAIAKGEFIQFLDADDFLDIKKFEVSVKDINNTFSNLVITNFLTYNTQKKKVKEPYCDLSQVDFNLKSMVLDWDHKFSIPIHCALISINLLRDFRFPNELQAKEDWIMWISIFKKKCFTSFVDLPLVYYRSHSDNMCLDRVFTTVQKQKALAHIKELLSFKEYFLYILKPKFYSIYIHPVKHSLYSQLFRLKRILHLGL
ncbi:glycosyltransferase [Leeuwenhoekiella sp. Mr9]|uniref:Glycosyltransferase n=1 Tax=Leeuwenhoekiella parthenopeia TaxID=2890320 RepID=A0ABS8GXY7_9FLAO|nr:glycosyltransferase [Leeuwenhoekiella parthenopeia]